MRVIKQGLETGKSPTGRKSIEAWFILDVPDSLALSHCFFLSPSMVARDRRNPSVSVAALRFVDLGHRTTSHFIFIFTRAPHSPDCSYHSTVGRMTMKSTRRVLDHSLAHLLARSLAPLTYSLASHCSLRSRAPLRSLTHSRAHGKV